MQHKISAECKGAKLLRCKILTKAMNPDVSSLCVRKYHQPGTSINKTRRFGDVDIKIKCFIFKNEHCSYITLRCYGRPDVLFHEANGLLQ